MMMMMMMMQIAVRFQHAIYPMCVIQIYIYIYILPVDLGLHLHVLDSTCSHSSASVLCCALAPFLSLLPCAIRRLITCTGGVEDHLPPEALVPTPLPELLPPALTLRSEKNGCSRAPCADILREGSYCSICSSKFNPWGSKVGTNDATPPLGAGYCGRSWEYSGRFTMSG